MSAPRFHGAHRRPRQPEAAGSVAITFAVPQELHEQFSFEPGQFLTLRAAPSTGRTCVATSPSAPTRSRYASGGELVGHPPHGGGVFLNWAARG